MAASLTFVDQATTFPARVWPRSRGQRAPDPARLDFTALATGRIPSSARLTRTATQGAPCQPVSTRYCWRSRLTFNEVLTLLGLGDSLPADSGGLVPRCGVQKQAAGVCPVNSTTAHVAATSEAQCVCEPVC